MLKSPEFYSSLRRGNLDATLCLKPLLLPVSMLQAITG